MMHLISLLTKHLSYLILMRLSLSHKIKRTRANRPESENTVRLKTRQFAPTSAPCDTLIPNSRYNLRPRKNNAE